MVTTPEVIEPDWLDKTTSIAPGETNRTSVRNLLGNPFLSSDYWNLDTFRQSAKQHEVDFVLIIPAFYVYSTFYRYTLVTYDENHIVNDIGTGLTHASLWEGANTEYLYRGLSLYVGHFLFIYDREFEVFQFLNSPNTANYLRSLRPLTECIAIIHTVMAYSDLTYLITSDNSKRKVVRPLHSRTLATLMPSSGRHTIEVSEKGVLGKESKSINCERGDVVYIDIHRVAHERQAFWKAFVTLKNATATFRIDLYDEMPDAFVGLSQIILSEGLWIVNPTQGRYSPDQ